MSNLNFKNNAGNLFCLLLVVLPVYFGTAQEIVNANPTTGLVVHTNAPVYYYVGDKLYYAPHGEIDLTTPIWQGKITERFYNGEVLVSPDSGYVVIHHETGLDVIDSVGNKICQLKNVDKSISDRHPDTFWCRDFQWSADSKALYLIKDVAYTSSGDPANRCALIKLDVTDGSLATVYNFTEPSWRFYLGAHNTVYYTAYDKKAENWQFKNVDLKTKAITPVYRDDALRLQTADTIYANLEFEQRPDSNIRITHLNYEDCNIYATNNNGMQHLLFEVLCGTNANKKKRFHLQEQNSEVYMPGEYYFGAIYTKEYATMVVNLQTLEYNFYKELIKPYVASTIQTENFMYTWGELMVKQ